MAVLSCASAAAAQYTDDFEDEPAGDLPSHWMESGYDETWNDGADHWHVLRLDDGNHVLRADQMSGERKALLHTFGQNVEFSADFEIQGYGDHREAQVAFIVRTSNCTTFWVARSS